MKHLFAGLAALTLAACGNSGETAKAAEAGDGSAVCPASEVITDVAQYRNDHPAAQDNALVWHIENSKRDGVKTNRIRPAIPDHQKRRSKRSLTLWQSGHQSQLSWFLPRRKNLRQLL